jgi:hypothetical protein
VSRKSHVFTGQGGPGSYEPRDLKANTGATRRDGPSRSQGLDDPQSDGTERDAPPARRLNPRFLHAVMP